MPEKVLGALTSMSSKDDKFYELKYQGGESAKLSILNDHVIRLHMSPDGVFREPTPSTENKGLTMVLKNVEDKFNAKFPVQKEQDNYYVETSKIKIAFKKNGMTVTHIENKIILIEEIKPLSYDDAYTTQELVQQKDEYFFGGGMHNGKFNHKGETININVTYGYAYGEVPTPIPFYWSSNHYGVFRNTWEEGSYDFSDTSKVITRHKSKDFDAFYFVSGKPENILHDYFELTGTPLLMPEYAFYVTYIRPVFKKHWVVDAKCDKESIKDEHGTCYKKSSNTNDFPENLNGDFPFSAKGWVNRFKKEDIPLGCVIINDNEHLYYNEIEELIKFIKYTSENGVRVGVWYQENNFKNEIEAGVVTFFTHSSGTPILYMMENVSNMLEKKNTRPMNCGLNGCAGIQRCSGLMSGYFTYDWNIMKFHIPTYIGIGLSGVPVVGSDVNGTYTKKIIKNVYIRDYQWKSFTPLQLIIDCCASFDNTPFSLDEEATRIIRAYLKLKSMLMPYNYTIAHESLSGLPMVRAMFLEFPDDIKYTRDCQYQFMWGQYFLIAPIYDDKESSGDSLRNGIYLPDQNQVWIDYFTGKKYQGGKVINELKVPLWKLPVFVKDGAIIPYVYPNNNPKEIERDTRIISIYPNGKEEFTIYEDDGISLDYKNKDKEAYAETKIEVTGPKSNEKDTLMIKINKTKGNYKVNPNRRTAINIMSSKDIDAIKVKFNDKPIPLVKVYNSIEFYVMENVFTFDQNHVANPYFEEISDQIKQPFILIKLKEVPVSDTEITITIENFQNKSETFSSDLEDDPKLETPKNLCAKTTRQSITLIWETVNDAEYYEISRDELIFSHIDKATTNFKFEDLSPKTQYHFKIRSMKDHRVSIWSTIVTETTQ